MFLAGNGSMSNSESRNILAQCFGAYVVAVHACVLNPAWVMRCAAVQKDLCTVVHAREVVSGQPCLLHASLLPTFCCRAIRWPLCFGTDSICHAMLDAQRRTPWTPLDGVLHLRTFQYQRSATACDAFLFVVHHQRNDLAGF
jgi:hypothetical protein